MEAFHVVLLGFALTWLLIHWYKKWKWARLMIARPNQSYPNNHHIIGVGFYHASAGEWFVHPWNEFQDARGYYWGGNGIRPQTQTLCLNPFLRKLKSTASMLLGARQIPTVWRSSGATSNGAVSAMPFGEALAHDARLLGRITTGH